MIYDYLLNQFTSKDDLKQNMSEPKVDGDKVYASDGHTLIVVPENKCRLKYAISDGKPDFKSVVDSDTTPDFRFSLEQLSVVLAKSKFRFEMKDCEKCDGCGQLTCLHCDNESDCKECDGTGKTNEVKNYSVKWFEHKDYIQLGDAYLNLRLMDKVLLVALACGLKDQDRILARVVGGKVYFTFDDILILCMGMYVSEPMNPIAEIREVSV